MRLMPSLIVLPLVLAAPAFAQGETAETPIVDHVAAVVIGFAAERTASVAGSETTYVQQDGPGSFHGTTEENGSAYTFVVTEPSPCVFEGRFEMKGQLFAMRFSAAGLKAVNFEDPEEMAGFTQYRVELNGPASMVERLNPDGSTEATENSSYIGTSLTPAELLKAATALVQHCGPS